MTDRPPPIHIALVRGVNVGGANRVVMADLCGLVAGLGFTDVRSLLQSGNLVFRGDPTPARGVDLMLSDAIERHYDVRFDVFVRSDQEWQGLIDCNPFPEQANRDPARLIVMFLGKPPAAGDVRTLRSGIAGPELISAVGREVYIAYPDGIGRSRLTGTVVERTLRARATGRNWNTVRKLAALAFG